MHNANKERTLQVTAMFHHQVIMDTKTHSTRGGGRMDGYSKRYRASDSESGSGNM